ncbi:MAG: shikimate dehydrogenase [Acidimicrobiaceae bacterium]|nr:shikimate dehydrogenase [Acidimicrobiaceae bacterium]
MININSQTRIAAIIGSPVAQSLSPVIHNAVFAARSVNWLYLAFHVEPGRARDALLAMSTLGIGGLSVTMPHKTDVATIVEEIGEIDEIVSVTGSANTVVLRKDSSLWATNTDGEGCCKALELAMKSSLRGARVVVLGAGGTGAAVAYALVQRGAGDVVVVNRSIDRAQELVKRIGGTCRVGNQSQIADDVDSAQVIINTTPVGFSDHDKTNDRINDTSNIAPIDVSLLNASHIVLDAVYRPLQTELLRGASTVGATVVDGLEMLVHQAALQQQFWIGEPGDVGLMRAAALASLEIV